MRDSSVIRDALGTAGEGSDEALCEASEAVGACEHHGREYFLYWDAGPCMHPACMGDRIRFWAATLDEHGREFRFALKHLDDFISHTLAHQGDRMLGQWDDPRAWARATEYYRDELKKDWLYQQLNLELKEVVYEQKNTSSASNAWGGYTMDAYSRRFVEECTGYLVNNHGAAVAATILEMIDLPDMARLEHNGDIGLARDVLEYAIEDLRQWLRRTNVRPKDPEHPRNTKVH